MKVKFKYVLGVVLTVLNVCTVYSDQYPSHPNGYAVASGHPLATNAGLQILREGGNAFDAAIAVAATLGVVEPYYSGLGGGSFWLLHLAKDGSNQFIDAREEAPLAATKDMYLDKQGAIIKGKSLNGGLAAAIPGQPAALVYISKHYGRLPLSKTLAPAIKLAREGFIVDPQFNYFSMMDDRLQYLQKYPATAAIFLKNGHAWEVGERLIQNDLANTLSLIAEKGHEGFYSGEVAKKLVKSVNEAGGIWTLQDLSHYQVKIREPLVSAYHNMLVITAPPPSAGGVALVTMLNILSKFPIPTFSKVEWIHYVAESMKLAFWQRAQFLGDPDFVKVPVAKLTSYENASMLSKLISPNKTIDSNLLNGSVSKTPRSSHTTHVSIIDSEGNRVSSTLTINYIFGSSVVADGTGVLLNDEMDDFSSQNGAQNVFGIVGSEANAIEPGKRPVSSMSPTFLEMPGRVAILGTPGGSRIPTMTLIASLMFYEGYGAISMVSAMRFHHQYLPDALLFEPDAIPPSVQEGLKALGHPLKALEQYYGDMQAITWDKETNLLTAASDPRHIGMAIKVEKRPEGYGIKH